jgi:hypothetical protein
MKISVWQKWASNHSVNFTIVGVFTSAEAAQKAGSELRLILHTITEWYRQQSHKQRDDLWGCGADPPSPTPPEIAFSQQYDVEWGEYAIDWLAYGWTHWKELRDYPVAICDRLVLVRTKDTGGYGEPFDGLIARLGGQPIVYNNDGSALDVNLSCMAPDNTTADMLLTWFQNRLDEAAQAGGDCWDMPDSQPDITPSGGSVRVEGCILYLSSLRFYLVDITHNLVTLFDFLKENGCTDIKYSLEHGE